MLIERWEEIQKKMSRFFIMSGRGRERERDRGREREKQEMTLSKEIGDRGSWFFFSAFSALKSV